MISDRDITFTSPTVDHAIITNMTETTVVCTLNPKVLNSKMSIWTDVSITHIIRILILDRGSSLL